ncbi:Response regulator receiver domain-containing protein [Amycolatopsis xylanica]|uniref:Response regulator receiver domain-containing protein n=1 Tax=Amycolatopsis xylanica TaxID=589385 RepID=A0A1H3R2W6_9PSEU|nr:response regulator [Amycolatopsis xylanica]SDZ19279.1 Response regulator receiver domain-containing protein [Amycolatopsis xylanica]
MRLPVGEDEILLAESLRVGLPGETYAVDLVHSGTDGLWLATEHRYTATVLDIMLPSLNGYRVCQRLRAVGRDEPGDT